MRQIIESAQENLAWHIEHAFECWCIGDVLGVRISWRAAQRCEHVIRLAQALEAQ